MYWKNISSVFAGTLLAQAIPIIGSIFIARIFTPSEFGKFSAWFAIVAIVITLRFEAVLAILEDGMARLKAVFFVFLIATGITILFLSVQYLEKICHGLMRIFLTR